MADEHDNTQARGNVPSNLALYIERAQDKRITPLELNDAVQDSRLKHLERDQTTIFNLINSAKIGGRVGAVGGGGTVLAGVIYALYEVFVSGGAPQ